MKTVAIIPARYASERLPGKPLADIAGKPMIQHVYERASRARLVDRVIVATDDERISVVVRSFGGEVVMTPRTLQSGSDRIAAVARSLEDVDIVVNVQGDEPLIEPEMIDQGILPLHQDPSVAVGNLIMRRVTSDSAFRLSIEKIERELKSIRNAA